MFGWFSDVVDAVVDFVTGGSDDTPDEPDPCDVGTCRDALDTRATARASAENACYHVRVHYLILITAINLVRMPWYLILPILIIAFIVAGPFGVGTVVIFFFFLLLFIRA